MTIPGGRRAPDRAAAHLDAHPRLGLLAARILVGDTRQVDPVCHLMAASALTTEPGLPGRAILGFVACGAVVRREAFLRSGGSDPAVHFGGEEERLALDLASAGWSLVYVEDVVAHHHPSLTRDHDTARWTLLARNRVLTAVMRRPWSIVLREARRAGAASLRQATPRIPAALRRRTVGPAAVEERLRVLEG